MNLNPADDIKQGDFTSRRWTASRELPFTLEDVVLSPEIDTPTVQQLRLKRISQQVLADARYSTVSDFRSRPIRAQVRNLRHEIDHFKRTKLDSAYWFFEGRLMAINPYLAADALSKDSKEDFDKHNTQYQHDIEVLLKQQIKDCKEQVICLHEGDLVASDAHIDYPAFIKALRDQLDSVKKEFNTVNAMTVYLDDFKHHLHLSVPDKSVKHDDTTEFRFDK